MKVKNQDDIPIAAPSNRALCNQTFNTCDVYSHCIDTVIPCGLQGFSRSYAEVVCETAKHRQHAFSSGCTSCSQVWPWLQQVEQCLQSKLVGSNLLNQFEGRTPDPPVCLEFEKKGLDALKECYYTSSKKLCSVVEGMEGEDTDWLFSLLEMSDYYRPWAQQTLQQVLDQCDNDTSNLFSEPQLHEVSFCIGARKSREEVTDPTIAQYKNTLAKYLDMELIKELNYIGVDMDNLCDERRPSKVNQDDSLHYHFVSCIPKNVNSSESCQLVYQPNQKEFFHRLTSQITMSYFEYSRLSSDVSCGDGVRQAGEYCDTGIYNGGPSQGCSLECTAIGNRECISDPLVPSHCAFTKCGDGLRTATEQCDDHNNADGDGCSSTCQTEDGYSCLGDYNQTSSCSLKQTELSRSSSLPPLLPTTSSPVASTAHTTSATSLQHTHTTTSQSTPTSLTIASSGRTLYSHERWLILPLILLVTLVTVR